MAKANQPVKKQNKIDLQNLSDRDKAILTLDVKDTMKKYKLEKQGVYDRRFALNKKIREAGVTVDQLLNIESAPTTGAAAKKVTAEKKTRAPKKARTPKKATEKRGVAEPVETVSHSRELMIVPEKNIPVVMKPIEINFDNFSIKLNGVPKKISVNPDTNSIEIDL
jgi:hypothetical protein